MGGGKPALAGLGRPLDDAHQGAGWLHRRHPCRPLQGRGLPLLSSRPAALHRRSCLSLHALPVRMGPWLGGSGFVVACGSFSWLKSVLPTSCTVFSCVSLVDVCDRTPRSTTRGRWRVQRRQCALAFGRLADPTPCHLRSPSDLIRADASEFE